MTNICNHINTFIDLNLVPGRHMAARLNDHSILVMLTYYLFIYYFINMYINETIIHYPLYFYHLFQIIENAHLPLTAADLNLNKNASYYDILPNSRISPQS